MDSPPNMPANILTFQVSSRSLFDARDLVYAVRQLWYGFHRFIS